ncbi:MAG: folate-binding protein, partial [Pseudomonadota bacterium]
TQAFRAHRLSYGVPEFGTDFEADDVFLMDVNYDVLGGVSYKKGCFVGQEVTSRMKRKGAVRKRTWCVKGPGLSSKAEITGPNGPIGAVTAAVDGVGLAIVRVDRVAAAGDGPFAVNGETVSLTPPAYLEDDPQ